MFLTVFGGDRLLHKMSVIGGSFGVKQRGSAVFGPLFAVMLSGTMMALSLTARAQSLVAPDANLALLSAVRVTASQTTPDAVPCGIDLRLLLPVVENRLQGGGLRATKSPDAVVTFSLMTSHDPAGQLCATAAMLGAYQLANYFDEKAGRLKSGYVVLWQRGAQVLSAPADHPHAVERTLARLTDNMLKTRRQQSKIASQVK